MLLLFLTAWSIYISQLQHWGLDPYKFVAFGRDGVGTMVGFQGGVATKLKFGMK